jgi:hypothetical protein
MSSLLDHFRREVAILRKKYEGDSLGIDEILPESVLPKVEALFKAFDETGELDAVAVYIRPIIAEIIKEIAFEPLSELTGDDEEWNEIRDSESSEECLYQNIRNSAVFKEGKDDKPYYLDGLIWRNIDSNVVWVGGINLSDSCTLFSHVYIKDLSKFDGKNFYVKVKKDEKNDDTYVILNPELLKEAEEVYELIYRN